MCYIVSMKKEVTIVCEQDCFRSEAEALAGKLGTTVCEGRQMSGERNGVFSGLTVRFGDSGVTLESGGLVYCADFSDMTGRLRYDNLTHELLVKAAKIKDDPSPLVLDATAGLGQDSLLLAASGFKVKLFERDPIIAVLLRDALGRASRDASLSDIVSRMEVIEGDSITAMNSIGESLKNISGSGEGLAGTHGISAAPDIIFLDPMFPEKTKNSLTKKKFQLIHYLEAPCADEDALVNAAIHACPAKIVVKRPLKAEPLGGVKPSYSLTGKTVRYDIIIPKPHLP